MLLCVQLLHLRWMLVLVQEVESFGNEFMRMGEGGSAARNEDSPRCLLPCYCCYRSTGEWESICTGLLQYAKQILLYRILDCLALRCNVTLLKSNWPLNYKLFIAPAVLLRCVTALQQIVLERDLKVVRVVAWQ